MKAFALIVAGGKGVRFGAQVPKQYLKLAGREIISYSMEAFSVHPGISGICVAAREEWKEHIGEIVRDQRIGGFLGVAQSVKERRDSVLNGLLFLLSHGACEEDVVLVHDAARPLLSEEVISRNIEVASVHGACVTVMPETDTPVISLDGETVSQMPPRRTVFRNQTPQSFRIGLLLDALNAVPQDNPNVTDDCSAAMIAGYPVRMVEGAPALIKITRQEDILFAQQMLERQKERKDVL